MLTSLQEKTHFTQTAFRDSNESYRGKRTELFQGLGQGNGAAPIEWALISYPIITMMRTTGCAFQTWSSITHNTVSFVCYTFVDYTDLVHTGTEMTTGEQVAIDMQKAVDHWEGGRQATGGALVPTKGFWYLIDFKHENNKW